MPIWEGKAISLQWHVLLEMIKELGYGICRKVYIIKIPYTKVITIINYKGTVKGNKYYLTLSET